jgi:hypothetical protein
MYDAAGGEWEMGICEVEGAGLRKHASDQSSSILVR